MRDDEARHRDMAFEAGAAHLPQFIKHLMTMSSKIMTRIAYFLWAITFHQIKKNRFGVKFRLSCALHQMEKNQFGVMLVNNMASDKLIDKCLKIAIFSIKNHIF